MSAITFAEYRKLPGVNWSTLKEMIKSPLHYRHRLRYPSEDTASRAAARAVHTAVLEPSRFELDYVVFDGPRRAGKVWDEFERAHEGETILKESESDACLATAECVRSHKAASKLLEHGRPEETLTWTDSETGILCKGRVDWLAFSGEFRNSKALANCDLKVIDSTAAKQASMLMHRNNWFCQFAHYQDGIRAVYGENVPCIMIAVEAKPPHDVGVFRIDDEAIDFGRAEVHRLLRKLADCRERNSWPGRDAGEQLLGLPKWVIDSDEPSELTLDGEAMP